MLDVPNRDRQAERREATRQEILAAAWSVAREQGLAQLTLREVAERVGMRAPSLYSHFASKNAIYDAMYAQAWTELLEVARSFYADLPADLREALRVMAHVYFDFAVSDLARNQLMNQRTLPGFEPTPESYAPAVTALRLLSDKLEQHGVRSQADVDLYVALIGGLVDSQFANDPGGDRWARLVDRAVDMYVDNLSMDTAPDDTATAATHTDDSRTHDTHTGDTHTDDDRPEDGS